MGAEYIHRRAAEGAEFAEKELTEAILAAAIELHRWMGPGLLESVYQRAMQHELGLRGLSFDAQVLAPVVYKGLALSGALRLDLIVAERVVVEIKSVATLEDIHRAQLLSYQRLLDLRTGLLINFNVPLLKQGIKRVANSLRPSAPSAPLRLCGE